MPRFRYTGLNGFIGVFAFGVGLPFLEGVEVELLAFLPDRFPGQILSHGVFQFRQTCGIRRQKNERVLVGARAVAPVVQNGLSLLAGGAFLLPFGVRMFRADNDQPGVMFIGNIAAAKAGVDATEVPACAGLLAQAASYFILNDVSLKLIGPVFSQAGHSGLGGEPITAAVHIQVGRTIRQATQGIAESCHGFSRLDAAEFDLPFVDATIGGALGGRGADIDSAGHATAGGIAGQVGGIALQLERQGVFAVHILGDDRRPLVV